jgi:hypothetical protein
MGANTFMTTSSGLSTHAAFYNAREEAVYEHGHGGYTGTIAEKSSFTVMDPPHGSDHDLIDRLADAALNGGDVPADLTEHAGWISRAAKIADDKWGPCVCVPLGDCRYLFFGWASS